MMGLDFDRLSAEELLAAESAILTMRSLMEAARDAPHGHGMSCLETVIEGQGFELLRKLLTTAAASHEGAQKKGSAVCHVPAEKQLRSNGANPRRS